MTRGGLVSHFLRTSIYKTVFFLSAAGMLQGAGNGLKGEYFNNTGLLGSPVLIRTDPTVSFTWNSGSPGPGISTNRFAVRWTGQVQAGAAGAYRFSTISDAGVRLWMNNVLVLDHWKSHTVTKHTSSPMTLAAGQKYNLKMEFYDNTGNAVAKLLWDPPNQGEAIIPQASLYSPAVTPVPISTYLSDLNPAFSQNSWGPYQRDRSNGETGRNDGRTISLGGIKFARGLGVHARSELRYTLGGRYKSFIAFVGVDDEVGQRGSVMFQAFVDNARVLETPFMTGANGPKPVQINVEGKNELKLIVLPGEGIGFDHADWADARLLNGSSTPGGSVPPAPTGLTAVPGNQAVKLSWTSVSGAASYNVYRATSPNGEATTPVMTGIAGTTAVNGGLANGTMYFFRVAAVNASGASAKSNEASAKPAASTTPKPPPAPTGLTAAPGDRQVKLAWNASAGAMTYNLYRATTAGVQAATPVMTGITGTTVTNTGLTNGTKYFFKVAAANAIGTGEPSNEANATPAGALPPAPTGLKGTPGDKQVELTWTESPGALSYNVYRGTSSNGQAATPVATGITKPSYVNAGLKNGTKYYFKVAAVNANGTGERSNEASATPVPPPAPPAPTGLTALPGDKQVVLSWTASQGAATYNVYQGTKTNGQGATPVLTGIAGTTRTITGLVNGTTYFFKVAAVNANGTSDRSNESSATPTAPGLQLTSAQKDSFRFLRQSTWGPTQALVDHVVQVGKSAFIDEQIAAPQSVYPETLVDKPNMELVSERFFQNALQGQDQLRQRVAWALSQIFVVSATKVDNTHAMVPYIRMLHARAFDNVRDILTDVTLSPAMGEFLDMVNNKKASNGVMPNENYGRELLQLFTIGLVMLNDDGTQQIGPSGPIPTYDQNTVAELSRVLTGWTYGDAVAGNPARINRPYYLGPMEPVASYHDSGQKVVLGQTFAAGQTAEQDLDQALTVIFNHPNLGPFLVRELIQRLVTSNPSPAYIRDVVTVFNNNGQGVRGDLRAVIRAILLHPEAVNGTPTSGKFSEPALFTLTFCRVICTNVVDHPFLTDFSQDMGQRVWFAPSVFNYFSPNYRAGALFAPEMQIWSTATAMTRTNFIASLVRGGFGSDVTLNLALFTAVAADTNALLDTVDSLVMGGTMSAPMRQAILTALNVSTSTTERVRTALYLTAASMQYQVEH